MREIGTLINSLCHIGFIVYILSSITEVKKMLRNIQKREQDKAESEEV